MLDPVQPLEYETGLFAYVFSVLHNLRGGPLEITGGRESKIFSVDEFFFRPICLHVFFFSTELLLMLKVGKASHSLIILLLGDRVFGVSAFAKFEYHDYRERNKLLEVSHLVP